MGDLSKIQWTEATWNPWHGCVKVSEGCKFCYMYRDKERYGQDPTTVLRSKTNFNAPLKWKQPKIIFTCSWSDWFIQEADEWRPEAWNIVYTAVWHTFQILTKRSERIADHLPANWQVFEKGYPNVWLGVSVENAKNKSRIDDLRKIPAAVRFLSIEPLLEDLGELNLEGIDWVIIGGESGNEQGKYRYRPCELYWIENILDQCKAAGVPVFVKQMGTYIAKAFHLKDTHGGNIDEFPVESFKVRQMPRQAETD